MCFHPKQSRGQARCRLHSPRVGAAPRSCPSTWGASMMPLVKTLLFSCWLSGISRHLGESVAFPFGFTMPKKCFSLLKKVLQRWAESPQCTRSSLLQAAATGSVSSYPTGITACSPLDTAPGPVPPSPSPPYLGLAPGFGNSQGWKGPGQSRSWCWRSQGLTGAQPAVTKASL